VNIEARFDKDGPYYTLRLMTHIDGKDIVVQEKANDIYGVIDAASDAFENQSSEKGNCTNPITNPMLKD